MAWNGNPVLRATKMFGAVACAAGLVAASVGLSAPAHALCVAPKSISGSWNSNDGGVYFMRRVGSNVWWLGDGPGNSWTNVFKGTLSQDRTTITGEWADVKPVAGSGTLTLRIQGALDQGIHGLERIGSSGDGFAGTRWFKPCNDT